MIQRTPSGYQIRWRDPDGLQRKETLRGATREDAERREREVLHLRDGGRPVFNPRAAPTFADFAATWTEERRGGWKHGTRIQYAQVIRVHLAPAFGALRVSFIDEGQVHRFLTPRRRRRALGPAQQPGPGPREGDSPAARPGAVTASTRRGCAR